MTLGWEQTLGRHEPRATDLSLTRDVQAAAGHANPRLRYDQARISFDQNATYIAAFIAELPGRSTTSAWTAEGEGEIVKRARC